MATKTLNMTCANCKTAYTLISSDRLEIELYETYGGLCDDCADIKNAVNAQMDAYDRSELRVD